MTRELRADLLDTVVEAPTMITARDLAALMRCDISTVHRMAREGRFPKPAQDIGGGGRHKYRWLTRAYVEWAEAHAPE